MSLFGLESISFCGLAMGVAGNLATDPVKKKINEWRGYKNHDVPRCLRDAWRLTVRDLTAKAIAEHESKVSTATCEQIKSAANEITSDSACNLLFPDDLTITSRQLLGMPGHDTPEIASWWCDRLTNAFVESAAKLMPAMPPLPSPLIDTMRAEIFVPFQRYFIECAFKHDEQARAELILQQNRWFTSIQIDIKEDTGHIRTKVDEIHKAIVEGSLVLGVPRTLFDLIGDLRSNVPPDPHTHVERPGPLEDLRKALHGDGKASVVGRVSAAAGGGFGKTVLAHRYANKYRDQYPGGVFRLGCSGRAIVSILNELLPSMDELIKVSESDRAKLVRAKLSGDKPSLLILDNIDNAEQWTVYRDSGLLPGPPCHVIVTTRDDHLRDMPQVKVEALEPDQAVALLANFRPSARLAQNKDAIAVILRETERLAALVAAVGAAMAEDQSDDWAGYAAWLKTAKPDELPDAGDWYAAWTNYPEKTAAILDDLRKRLHPAMVRVLDYAALLPADSIAPGWLEFLLECDTQPDAPGGPLALPTNTRGTPHTIAWVLDNLRARDLLKRASDESSLLAVHRLHRKRAADHLAANISIKERLLDAIVVLAESRGKASQDAIYGPKGEPDEAKRLAAREFLRAELSPLSALIDGLVQNERPVTGLSLANWTSKPLFGLARYSEGFANLHRFVAPAHLPFLEYCGDKHTSGLSNLALIQKEQGDLQAARVGMEKSIAIRSKHALSPDHPTLAISYSNLALIKTDQGDLAGARADMEKAIAINFKHFASDHPTFATRFSNLALIHREIGKQCRSEGNIDTAIAEFAAARANVEKAIAIDSQHFPPDYPTFAVRYSILAMIQQSQSDLQAARVSMEKSIAIRSKHLPPDHPTVAMDYSNLAGILHDKGDLYAARESMEKAIAINSKHFAPDHPTLAINYNNLAHICIAEGKVAEAVALWRRSYPIRLKALGPDHPYTKGDVAMLRKYDPPGP